MAISSLYAYFNPMVAMIIGSVLLGEKITFHIVLGTFITLAGVYLVNYSMKPAWKRKIQKRSAVTRTKSGLFRIGY